MPLFFAPLGIALLLLRLALGVRVRFQISGPTKVTRSLTKVVVGKQGPTACQVRARDLMRILEQAVQLDLAQLDCFVAVNQGLLMPAHARSGNANVHHELAAQCTRLKVVRLGQL